MSRNRPALLVLVGLFCVSVIALLNLPFPTGSLMQRVAFDVGHVPLFGVFSLAVLGLFRRPPHTGRVRPYLWSLALSCAVGLVSEGLQFFGPRDADLGDLFRNAAGAASFLLIAFSFDRARAASPRRGAWTTTARGLAALLLLAGVFPALVVGRAFLQRNAAFPVLYEPNATWTRPLSKARDGWIVAGELPDGRPAEVLTFLPRRYPGLILNEPYPDWSGYRLLAFEIYSDGPQENLLWVRINDEDRDEQDAYDWYVKSFPIDTGRNEIRIPLEEIRDAPRERTMDLTRVRLFMFFLARPAERIQLRVGRIRLEK